MLVNVFVHVIFSQCPFLQNFRF